MPRTAPKRVPRRPGRRSRSRRHRRWPFLLGGLVILLALVAGGLVVAWKIWAPSYRPSLLPGERYGIDVSAYQGNVNWKQVAASGISFVYIKATEGSSFLDPDFAEDRTAAESAGLEVGAYHFFSLCSSGRAQAAAFLRAVGPRKLQLPPAVDLEPSTFCSARPSAADVRAQLAAFLAAVEPEEGRAVLYVSGDFEAAYPVERWFSRKLWWRACSSARPETDGSSGRSTAWRTFPALQERSTST